MEPQDKEKWSRLMGRLVKVYRSIYPEDRRDDTSIVRDVMNGLVRFGAVKKYRGQYGLPESVNWDAVDQYIDAFEKIDP
jgi:hypothetical protein